MSDLFKKRMENLYKSPPMETTLARKSVLNTISVNEVAFTNDPNYKRGMIYDWDLNKIEEIDFKFQKNKSHTLSNDEVEYHVQFREGFNPEKKYKNLYYRDDGKERLGFYLDVEDERTGVMEKWIILGKDDKSYLDRYLALKCNWVFEWTDRKNKVYKSCLGVLRVANSYTSGVWSDGISTSLNDIMTIVLPTNKDVSEIEYSTRFMLGDSSMVPKVYEITKNLSTFPLGVSKLTVSQCYYNEHTDYYGKIEDIKNLTLTIDYDTITDVMDGFGGEYHMLCDLIKSKIPTSVQKEESPVKDNTTWSLKKSGENLIINGQKMIIEAISNNKDEIFNGKWNVYVDNTKYTIDELEDYFDIVTSENKTSIFAKNKIMVKYIVKVEITDEEDKYIDSVEMEVAM